MKKKQIIALAIILTAAVSLVNVPRTLALDCVVLPQSFCDASEEGNLEQSGTWLFVLWVLRLLTAGIGVVAVAMIGFHAFLYATAGDNSNQTKEAKEKIRNTLVGLVLYGFMYVGLEFLIPGGVFK